MDYEIGQKEYFSKTISEFDIYQFAGITGDFNPIHTNEIYASNTKFGRRVAHGMLVSSFICTALGTKMPGVGTIHVSQQLDFLNPVFIGDTITVSIEIIEILHEKKRLKIKTTITNQNQIVVVDGYCIVKPPQKKEFHI